MGQRRKRSCEISRSPSHLQRLAVTIEVGNSGAFNETVFTTIRYWCRHFARRQPWLERTGAGSSIKHDRSNNFRVCEGWRNIDRLEWFVGGQPAKICLSVESLC